MPLERHGKNDRSKERIADRMFKQNDILLSDQDEGIALSLLHTLVRALGDRESREVSTGDVRRVLALMSAMVIENDLDLESQEDFAAAGANQGDVVGFYARILRDQNLRAGSSAISRAVLGRASAH
jgi:hypothetical protein